MPSSPIRLSAGMRRLSKKISVVLWLIIASIGLMSMPLPRAARISTRKVESPSLRRLTWSGAVVRARSSIRSECNARLVQTFWPLITYSSPSRSARVLSCVVSEPVVGSVTPKACRRSSPLAILGRNFFFCSGEPCRRTVPMVYICAWHAAALQPLACIVSRMTAPARIGRPAPPYSSGISAPR